jgi:hypothetical protein
MMSVLERRDWQIMGVGVILSIIGAVVGQIGLVTMRHDIILAYSAVLPILLAVVFVLLARRSWGGQVSRYLELIGTGFMIHVLIWIPHIRWHLLAEAHPEHVPPAWAGMDPAFWYVFFHASSLLAFGLITYGFYLFWKEGTA